MALWKFTANILSDKPIDVYDHGDMRRDFSYIDDIVARVIASFDRPPIDDGKERAGDLGRRTEFSNIGIRTANGPDLGNRARVRSQAQINRLPMQDGDVQATFADIDAIRSKQGYEPSTPIGIGVLRFVQWFGWEVNLGTTRGFRGKRCAGSMVDTFEKISNCIHIDRSAILSLANTRANQACPPFTIVQCGEFSFTRIWSMNSIGCRRL